MPQKIGLDVERFKNDMAGKDAKARVDADLARGRGMSINSTPSLFINGKAIPLDSIKIDSLRQLIDSEIQNAMKTQSSSPANNSNAKPAAPASNK